MHPFNDSLGFEASLVWLQNAKANPVRAVVEGAPAEGVPKYDFLRQTVRQLIEADPNPGATPVGQANELIETASEGH